MELIGKVTKIGRIKDYGHETNFGKTHVEITKFFLSVETTDQGLVNAMVQCNAQDSEYGYRISKDEPRQRPFIGDTVKFTTQRLRTGNDGTKWASITFNQNFEITEQNMDARKEREDFIAAKKAEREEEFRKKIEAQKQARADAKKARITELDAEKTDERLPEAVRAEITQTFDLNRIISLLRDTTWFTMPEGEGGKRCEHDGPVACGCQHPGTGMRRRGGSLYDTPASIRASILAKGIKSGLIIETENGYKATPTGVKLLKTLDTCLTCNELREPYHTVTHHTSDRYSQSYDGGIRYHCKCEMKQITDSQKGCNFGNSFQPVANIDKKRERIALTISTMEEVKLLGNRCCNIDEKDGTIVKVASGYLDMFAEKYGHNFEHERTNAVITRKSEKTGIYWIRFEDGHEKEYRSEFLHVIEEV